MNGEQLQSTLSCPVKVAFNPVHDLCKPVVAALSSLDFSSTESRKENFGAFPVFRCISRGLISKQCRCQCLRSSWDKIEFMLIYFPSCIFPVPHVSVSKPRVLELFPRYGWCRELVVCSGVMRFFFCLTLCTDEYQECLRWLSSKSQAANDGQRTSTASWYALNATYFVPLHAAAHVVMCWRKPCVGMGCLQSPLVTM